MGEVKGEGKLDGDVQIVNPNVLRHLMEQNRLSMIGHHLIPNPWGLEDISSLTLGGREKGRSLVWMYRFSVLSFSDTFWNKTDKTMGHYSIPKWRRGCGRSNIDFSKSKQKTKWIAISNEAGG